MSLLIKCKFLTSIKDILKKICYVCLTPSLDTRCLTEIDALQKLIRNRPRDKMNDLIDASFRVDEESLILNSTAVEANKTFTKIKFDSFEKKTKQARKQTIKDKSPFSLEFLKIQNEVKSEIMQTEQSSDENPLYSPDFIEHLNE